jgi:fido (protein-threonine AMPylation protein)
MYKNALVSVSATVAGRVTDQHDRATDTHGRPMPSPATLRGSARRREDTSSMFVRAPNLTAAQTSARLSDSLTRALQNLATNPPTAHPTITVARLMLWHRAVFGGLFSSDAGRPRHSYEDVVFSNIYTDEDGEEYQRLFHGCPGQTITRRLETACAAFAAAQDDHAAGTIDLAGLARHLAELMAEILRIHPFLDGNHRIRCSRTACARRSGGACSGSARSSRCHGPSHSGFA